MTKYWNNGRESTDANNGKKWDSGGQFVPKQTNVRDNSNVKKGYGKGNDTGMRQRWTAASELMLRYLVSWVHLVPPAP